MKDFGLGLIVAVAALTLWHAPVAARATDVRGYSILKGQFLNQVGPDALVTDPDFGFSILASVDLTEFYLVTNASLALPSGNLKRMEDLGDAWSYLDSHDTLLSLNTAYESGNYTVVFKTVNDGK